MNSLMRRSLKINTKLSFHRRASCSDATWQCKHSFSLCIVSESAHLPVLHYCKSTQHSWRVEMKITLIVNWIDNVRCRVGMNWELGPFKSEDGGVDSVILCVLYNIFVWDFLKSFLVFLNQQYNKMSKDRLFCPLLCYIMKASNTYFSGQYNFLRI